MEIIAPMLAEAEKYILKWKKQKVDGNIKQVTVTKKEKKGSDSDEVGFVMYEIALAGKKSLLDEYDILCDNQTTINIFRNKNIPKHITTTEEIISVSSVGEILEVNQIGYLPGLL